jgi:hypothetical protein
MKRLARTSSDGALRDPMRRAALILTLAFVCVTVTASGALGFAANFDYTGHVKGQPTEFVGFFIKHAPSGHRKVVGFTVSQIPYACSDAPPGATAGWRFKDRMRVRRDRTFEGTGDWVDLPQDPTGAVSGKLRRRGVAVGDFKLRGELAGPGTHCHTGLLDWRATKQQPSA